MTACRLCQQDSGQPVSQVDGIWPGEWPVYFCEHCEYYFLEPMPTDEQIKTYYEQEYWSHSLIMDKVKQLFRHFRVSSQCAYLARLLDLDQIRGHCVEVGAADAELIGNLKVSGKKIALEPSEYYAARAYRKFGLQLRNVDIFAFEEAADLFLLSHSIEHFTDPMAVLSHCAEKLNPGGYIFIEVPNSPLPVDVDTIELKSYLNTEHIVNYRYKSLKKTAEDNNLEVLDISRFSNRLPANLSNASRRRIAAALIGERKPKLTDLPVIGWYMTMSAMKPDKSYAQVETSTPYLGLGDNLRMLVRKPTQS